MDTSIIGPVTIMESFIGQFGKHSSAVHGILVSCILLCAALGSLFAGTLADRLGRPKAMAFGAGVFIIGTILEAAAVKLSMFAVGRVIEGIGYGLYFSTQTVYICEISPTKARGPLTSGPQFMTCVALVVGYFISYGTVKIPGSLSWRLPFIIISVMAILYLLINLFLLPESPRWLIRHRNYRAAEKVWDQLEVKQEDRETENDKSPPQDPTAIPLQSNLSEEERNKPYAPLLFQQAGLESQEASFLVSICIPATLLADKWGRRTSTLVGGVGLTALMILNGSLYAGYDLGHSIKVWAPEIQPQHTRAQATSLAYAPIGVPSAYFLFGGCTAVATVVSFFYMVETKGKSLAEIERAFRTRIPVARTAIPMVRLLNSHHETKAA
ncbi:MFS transporter [Penicillium vulpinum]|uniref:MFS transporter n=1 Tax=Penicillium vulpinum TaxID=29845 RepID=UPI002548F4B3|nr:MFS transporter [Penicillium vulpinum]KAJ5960214.1 MFS transporter [Penicillium vulpinum]